MEDDSEAVRSEDGYDSEVIFLVANERSDVLIAGWVYSLQVCQQ